MAAHHGSGGVDDSSVSQAVVATDTMPGLEGSVALKGDGDLPAEAGEGAAGGIGSPMPSWPSLASPSKSQSTVSLREVGGRALYEVCSGVAPLRAAPSDRAPSLGMLSGGTRFYATPHQMCGGRAVWLHVQSEGVMAPIFSPTRASRATGGGSMSPMVPTPSTAGLGGSSRGLGRGGKLYEDSAPQLLFPAGDRLADASELWVKMDDRCIAMLRLASTDFLPRIGPPQGGSPGKVPQARRRRAPLFDQDDPSFSQAQEAKAAAEAQLRRVRLLAASQAAWAQCGPGAWCNFRSFGVTGSAPSANCGRWRQL